MRAGPEPSCRVKRGLKCYPSIRVARTTQSLGGIVGALGALCIALDDRHMDVRPVGPFSFPRVRLGDPCHEHAWHRNALSVGYLLVKLHATGTVVAILDRA